MARLISGLQEENEQLRLENDRLKGVVSVDKVKAELIAPCATKVFRFLVVYCLAVAAMIFFDGFKAWGFDLNKTVLGIVAGSTAVSAIGLVGIVVRGLFGPGKSSEAPSDKPQPVERNRRR